MIADTDRELLELAAKAAGRQVTGWNKAQGEEVAVLDDGTFWQPLHKNRITDSDGDALRLAVTLRMLIGTPGKHGRQASAQVVGVVLAQDQSQDPCTATCRSIVLAAAEIGKAMK